MKLNYLIPILLILAGCSKKATEGYHITGNFTKGSYSGYIYLNTPYQKDSCKVKNNEFEFTGKTNFPIQGWLTLETKSNMDWLYVENNNISITINSPEEMKVTAVTGSESYKKQNAFNTFIENHINDNNFNYRLKDSLTGFILANPKHSLSGLFLAKVASETWILSPDEVKQLKSKLDTSKQSRTDLFVIDQAIEKLSKFGIGSTFKDFELTNMEGTLQSTATINSPYLLVDFWASWCVPCRKQNPEFVKVYNQFHNKGFDILSISIEDDPEQWQKAITKDHLTWNHLRSGNEFDSDLVYYYEFYSIPYNILIDKNRKVLGVNLEPGKLKIELQHLLQ